VKKGWRKCVARLVKKTQYQGGEVGTERVLVDGVQLFTTAHVLGRQSAVDEQHKQKGRVGQLATRPTKLEGRRDNKDELASSPTNPAGPKNTSPGAKAGNRGNKMKRFRQTGHNHRV